MVSAYNPPEVLSYFKSLGAVVARKYANPPLYGEAQKYNAGLAIKVAKLLKIDETSINSGINAAKLNGRCEVLTAKDGRTFVLDGAHNPSAFAPLRELITNNFGKADVIFGSLSDKNVRENLEIIKSFASSVTLVRCNSPRNIDAEKLRKECVNLGICAGVCKNITDALENSSGKVTVVCGSFTLIREAIRWIENK